MKSARVAPEFSRPVKVRSLEPGVNELRIEADAGEREALARRFDLVAIGDLAATIRLTPDAARRTVRLEGNLTAEITQTCVVTLEPIERRIEAPIERLYADDAPRELAGDVTALDEIEDLPDPIVGGAIDVGEAAAEQLALEIDPFPRRADARFRGYMDAAGPPDSMEARPQGPFAVLAKLKGRSNEDG